ncbi:pyridoxal phosphate-dependent decarboxylase family protein [Nocardioides campestrisoli]|uniref:pyridoxal phosphate-dependent decarboxylase family protein n=1 Tax=Nocardioides campestrisoli TaxID=2736757 RepID=UPI001C6383B3|nr:pyridoxal-dependent decarboxylase [Nocardioides campestrisoli]
MTGPHMSPEEFRRHGHAVVDWIADYWSSLDELPVRSRVAPGEIAAALPDTMPETGEEFDAVLADVQRMILPGITHWQHPRFFAYFPANSSPAAVLGDLLSSGIGAQGMLWATSPALTEVEQVVLDWLAEGLGLPEAFRSGGPGGGVIQDTASTATFTALLAALHRTTDGAARAEGVTSLLRVYGSEEAHSSLHKAVMMSGLGERALHTVPVDPRTRRMDVAALARALEEDVAAGLRPVMVQAAVGTTSTGAVDDVAAIGPLALAHGAWLHVDAAWAGTAAVCPEHRWINEGVAEHADSYVTNPHKWLLTTFDCSAFWVRDSAALRGALSLLPEYLRTPAAESGAVTDLRDWHPQLGRRFRALKLFAVLRTYGRRGLAEHIRAGVAGADRFASLVRSDERFELVTEPVLGLVVFRLRAGDEETRRVMEELNDSGEAYLSHTTVDGSTAMRVAVGGWRTTPEDVERTWRALTSLVPADPR